MEMIDQTSSNTEKVYVDAVTGRRYSFNSMTGKSVWIDKNQEVASKNIISMFQPKANTKKTKPVKGNATNTSKMASALNISTIRTVVSAANKLKKNSQRQRTISVGQKFKKAVKGIGRKIVQAELGTSTYGGDNVPLLVGDYLAGKTKFEMEIDERWEDYNYSTTHSIPPLYSKKTANVCAAFPCYPCCCLPCCCKNKNGSCKPYGCPDKYAKTVKKKDRTNKCLGGFGCMGFHGKR